MEITYPPFLRTKMTKKIPFWYLILRLIGRQDWIRWSLRYRLLQLIKPEEIDFVVPFFGKKYKGSLNSFVDRGVFFWGAHEREFILYMNKFISNEAVVLDIGANVGHHSLYFSTLAKEIHAFEPFPEVADKFEEKMCENSITNVHLHRVGLGNKTMNAAFYAPVGDNRGIGSFTTENNPENKDIGNLPIVRGDEIIQKLNLKRLDFIKIDVERYEKEVLIGLQETLKEFRPVIEIEYTPDEFESEADFLSLFPPNYIPYMMKINRSVLYFFNRSACKLEPFQFNIPRAEVLLIPSERKGQPIFK